MDIEKTLKVVNKLHNVKNFFSKGFKKFKSEPRFDLHGYQPIWDKTGKTIYTDWISLGNKLGIRDPNISVILSSPSENFINLEFKLNQYLVLSYFLVPDTTMALLLVETSVGKTYLQFDMVTCSLVNFIPSDEISQDCLDSLLIAIQNKQNLEEIPEPSKFTKTIHSISDTTGNLKSAITDTIDDQVKPILTNSATSVVETAKKGGQHVINAGEKTISTLVDAGSAVGSSAVSVGKTLVISAGVATMAGGAWLRAAKAKLLGKKEEEKEPSSESTENPNPETSEEKSSEENPEDQKPPEE